MFRIPRLTNAKALHGIIFDMDGTLTLPSIDFPKLRKALVRAC